MKKASVERKFPMLYTSSVFVRSFIIRDPTTAQDEIKVNEAKQIK